MGYEKDVENITDREDMGYEKNFETIMDRDDIGYEKNVENIVANKENNTSLLTAAGLKRSII